jgi:hypothetical protein
MKNFLLVFLLSFLFYSSVSAQTPQNTWGLGVALVSGGAVFHLPIIFENIRIEPEISFRTSSSTSGSTFYYIDSYQNETETSSSSSSSGSISIGTGAYYSFRIDKSADWYIGPRIGFTRNSSVSDNSTIYDRTYTDSTSHSISSSHLKQHAISYFAGAVLGGEYFFSSHFSAGAELLVTYTNSGQPVIDEQSHVISPSPSYTSSSVSGPSTSSSFAESTAVYIRWYF